MHPECVNMDKLEKFKINLGELENGEHTVSLSLDDEYFKAIEASDIQHGSLTTELTTRRNGDVFELKFHTVGDVTIPCDLCLDDMKQSVDTDNRLMAQFGDEYSEDDDLVTVAEDEGILDVSWLIYEFIELSIPIRHVHAPGKCNPVMMRILKEHSAARSSDENAAQKADPRWAALSKLKDKS